MRRSEVEQIVQVCRELAFTLIPSSSPPPACVFDPDAEAELLASMWDNFWPAVLRGLEHLGTRGPHVEAAVTRLLEDSPVAVRPDAAAHRVRSLAWRRRMVSKLDRLRVLISSTATTDAEVETAFDSLVESAAAQPCSGVG
jgi:hypothetical protein